MGWDAFGLPAENAAIKNQTPPREWTLNNIAQHEGADEAPRLQLRLVEERSPPACPEYYRWNQWFFLKIFERGLAYRKKSRVNWCPECETVLANEQVVDGCCWRHEDHAGRAARTGAVVPAHHRLRRGTARTDLDTTRRAGRKKCAPCSATGSAAARARWSISNWMTPPARRRQDHASSPRASTPSSAPRRVQLAPEHPLVADCIARESRAAGQGRRTARRRSAAREAGDIGAIEKNGVFTGRYAINPFNGERVPIWVANYVLMDYGTGAIMSVPAHDERDYEFAKKYGLEIRIVILPRREGEPPSGEPEAPVLPFIGEDSLLINSGEFSGLPARKRSKHGRRRRGARLRQGHRHLPPQGLGHLPPALLGHADPHDLLRQVRPGARAGRAAAGAAAGERGDHAGRRLAARAGCRSLSTRPAPSAAARRAAKPTPWTPSSIRPGISIATPSPDRDTRPSIRRSRELLVPHRPVHRRSRARHPAPDLFALLDQVHARPRPGPERRARASACSPRAWSSRTAPRCRSRWATWSRPTTWWPDTAPTPRACTRCLPRRPTATWIGRTRASRASAAS